jgi:hypothetical protein
MKRRIHLCQSVEGALKNWGKAEWASVAKSSKCTIEELKQEFWDMHSKGIRVIPVDPTCEGFDYQKGCPGHEVKDENSID